MDRRTILLGAGALTLAGCKPAQGEQVAGHAADAVAQSVPLVRLDFSELEQRFKGRLGLAFHVNGATNGWRAEERFVYCSTFKMYLAVAMFVRAQNGLENLDREVPITQADMISHAPITEKAVGKALSIKALMKGTVEESDNPAANILLREMGGLEAMRQFYRDLGDTTTRVDRFEPEMNRLDGDKDTIQPLQSVTNMQRLFTSDQTPLDETSKATLLQWMFDSPTGADRIKAALPEGWTVAHKTGTGGYGPANDIGLIYPPTGEPIVIAIYFHGGAGSTPRGREQAIAEATRTVLRSLGPV
ncbi:class A beta-lactamase [uncultured Brevundimonas sp.]|uniref:class A beta-lactamase n=1 Tax=uncultured Brevundimonas sp. TaxID=213418 RepID=UPI0026151D49|nr:class A beta-lactamase [uncultured Brevundimonas sp.]